MTIDRELVTRKMALIARDLEPLREIHGHGSAAFQASSFHQAVVEREMPINDL